MSALHVIFKVGAAEYALAAADVLQMESYSGATPVPGAPPFVAGIVQVRGRVLPLLDLRARFGLPEIENTVDRRIVVGQHEGRPVALLVDSAREVIDIAPELFKPPPRLASNEAAGLVKAVAQVGPRLLMLLDFPKVVGPEVLDGSE
ncbi:MAG TPA: chemotaxis protein CheW [Anaeromyxobacteraceae bacterium]|nr:chemotaxis protein CheW [Anaeromyxobacteraceae bacterium]